MCPLAAPAVEQLEDFLLELVVFRSQRTAGRMAAERLDLLNQAVIPACGGVGSVELTASRRFRSRGLTSGPGQLACHWSLSPCRSSSV